MRILDIYITDLCNLHCEYCYVDLKKVEFDGFIFKEFTQRVNLLEYDSIKFYWGEPMLKYKEIQELIISVRNKKSGMNFTIITNGLLLSREKLDFFLRYNISLGISIHQKALRTLIAPNYLNILLPYKRILGFLILMEESKEDLAIKIFNLLRKFGFHIFSFTPITTDNWEDLTPLKKQLDYITRVIKDDPSISIADSDWRFIKDVDKDNFCRKNQIDRHGEKKSCNRFHEEEFVSKKENIYKIHDIFNDVNNCDNCKDRWFCTCPIWWYLDNKHLDIKTLRKKVKIFHHLNVLFIDFHRDISEICGQKNFLTRNIDEIRFNITEQCNLRCNYCYLDFSDKVLAASTWRNILDFYLEQDGDNKVVSFFWGEPLLEFPLIQELVWYAQKKAQKLWKEISFKIATNALLFTEKNISFFHMNNFVVHISMNGNKESNDFSRDNSSGSLLKKLDLVKSYIAIENIHILYALHPSTLSNFQNDLIYIYNLGLKNIHVEISLSEWKWFWKEEDFLTITRSLIVMKKNGFFEKMNILNMAQKTKRVVLDISTDWKVDENSFTFFDKKVDFSPKKKLDLIFEKLTS